MKSKKQKSMYTILARIVATICFISALSLGIIFAITGRQNTIKSSDERLLSSAILYHELLGRHYHDKIIDSNSVTSGDYLAILERNGEICRDLNLQYLWSVLEIDGELVFTSATRSNLTIPDSVYAQFFETHRNPEAFSMAMAEVGKPVFSTFQNEWGEGRMILIPKLDDKGRRYIIGASIQLEEIKFLIYKSTFLSIILGVFLFVLAWFISDKFTQRLVSVCSDVTLAANRIRDGDLDTLLPQFNISEAQNLTDSLDDMRNQLKLRIIELEKNNTILNQIVLDKNTAEEKLKETSNLQSLLLNISSHYINISSDEIDSALQDSLEELGRYVGADRAYIFDYDWNLNLCTNTYEWCREGIIPEIENLQNVPFKMGDGWSTSHEKGELVHIESVLDLSDDNPNKSILMKQGIKSLTAYPIKQKDDCMGFVGFDWVKEFHVYSENEEKILAIFSGMLVNLTVRKKDHLELERFKFISDNALYGKAITDLRGNLVYINNTFAKIHGYSSNELIGKNLSIFHNEEQQGTVFPLLEKLLKDGFFGSTVVYHIDRDGNEFPMLMSGLLLKDSNSQPELMATTAIDITELVEAQKNIKTLLKKETHLNNNLRNFTQIVSHNLRIHTANMMGILMMLRETEPDLYQNESVQMLRSASEKLEETILDLNAVLEIKFESQLNKLTTSLHSLVKESIQGLVTNPNDRNVEIINQIPEYLTIYTEVKYLKSILGQIIGNAIKYNSGERKSWVIISCKILPKLTEITIEDNGIGIDLERNGKDLFKMYKKFHNSPDSKGFGLYLAQVQAESLGGGISVASEVGLGSKFTVSIPYE